MSETYKRFADVRGSLFISIILDSDLEENKKRLRSGGRGGEHNSKLTDVGALVDKIEEDLEIYNFGWEGEMSLDVTSLEPEEVARRISSHIEACFERSGRGLGELCRCEGER